MKIKTLFQATLMVILALAGGIGGAFFYAEIVSGDQAPLIMPPNRDANLPSEHILRFEIGDLLPQIFVSSDFENPAESQSLINERLSGSPSVIVFSSMLCDRCIPFINQWNEQIADHLNDDVKAIALLPVDDGLLINSELEHFERFDLFRISEETMEQLGVRMLPSLVCVSEDGLVVDIQYGFSRMYHRTLIEQYTDYDLD